MDRRANGHSADYIKRQATKYKKNLGIPHHVALDLAAKEAGFSNWKHFLNGSTLSIRPVDELPIKKDNRPKPLTLVYGVILSTRKYHRPNARMPVQAHQELARLLREARSGALFNKKAENAIGMIRTTLDDWVQKEYPSEKELPNELFHDMYYGHDDFKNEPTPSEAKKIELINTLIRAKTLFNLHYHNCEPVRWVNNKFSLAVKSIENWPKAKKERKAYRKIKPLTPGTLVRIKKGKKLAIVLQQDEWTDTIKLYSNSGPFSTARHEVSALSDQSAALSFRPMRLFIPYGKWTCADGTEVLFNRDYCPLWARSLDGEVIPIDPDTWINYVGESLYYFNDGTTPWSGNEDVLAKGMEVLKQWGVENTNSPLLNLLPIAIETGEAEILRPKSTTKNFPLKKA